MSGTIHPEEPTRGVVHEASPTLALTPPPPPLPLPLN